MSTRTTASFSHPLIRSCKYDYRPATTEQMCFGILNNQNPLTTIHRSFTLHSQTHRISALWFTFRSPERHPFYKRTFMQSMHVRSDILTTYFHKNYERTLTKDMGVHCEKDAQIVMTHIKAASQFSYLVLPYSMKISYLCKQKRGPAITGLRLDNPYSSISIEPNAKLSYTRRVRHSDEQLPRTLQKETS